MREEGPKIYGPYEHGEQFRVHIVTGRGSSRKTTYQTYETRALADAFIAGARDEAQGVTVRAAVDLFIEKQRTRGNADTTIENYEHRLWMILGLPENAERPIRWVAPRAGELYAATVGRRAADTHLNALSVAKRWGAFCVKQKLLKANPFADVEGQGRRRKGSGKDRLRVDESRVLQAACHSERGVDGTLTLSYLLLGPRASEMSDRVVRDLDDGGRLLWIDRTKTDAGSRRFIVPDELRPLLLELAGDRSPHERLFLNLAGDPMSRRVAYQRVMAFTKRILGREIGPQGLRRTQSTLATDAGATGPMVSAHLGHVTEQRMAEITERSYVDPNAVRDAKVERSFKVLAGGKR